MTASDYRLRVGIVLSLTILPLGVMLAVKPFPQPLSYHNFADQRPMLCVPHALNVLSNLPFVIVGMCGLLVLYRRRMQPPCDALQTTKERHHYLVFFLCIALTGIGSAYYHAEPTNDRLMWDRLPLAMAFMALFASVIAERVSIRAGNVLFWPLVLLGAGSVLYWHHTEMKGAGDLRLYLLVQFFPMLVLPFVLALFPPRYTRTGDLIGALAWYVVAKVLELLDYQVYAAGQLVSGHTLKHLVAGGSAYLILHMLERRRPV